MEECPRCHRPYGRIRRCYFCAGRPRTGQDVPCATCGQAVYSAAGTPRTYCSAQCRVIGIRRRYTEGWQDRFWARVAKSDGCWEWQGPRSPAGYGFGSIRSQTRGAHRIAWEIVNGSIPAGKFIRHICDNPPCVRPDHLRIGEPAENSADMVARGRSYRGPRTGKTARGSEVGTARFTEAQVLEMRRLFAEGMARRAIAEQFAADYSHVCDIVARRIWRHI
jgi:hypothetical protein